jgi:hypothetical protein
MKAIQAIAVLALAASGPGQAEVTSRSEQGFAIQHSAQVAAGAEQTWRELVRPAAWWNKAHTWSGDAANLTLEPRIGGCFCEALPPARGQRGARAGTAEHLRVINVVPGKMLRLSGALGPLQSEAVQGTLTITLTPAGAGTQIKFEYVVGGYMRFKTEQIAPAVNAVLGEQVARLAARLGGNQAVATPAK